MSYGKFACILPIDRRLRYVLIGGGAVCWVAGGWLVCAMPLSVMLRAVVVLLWTAASFCELRAQYRSLRRIDRIRITSEGAIDGIAADGRRFRLELLSGSMLLAGGAWLRFRFPDGSHAGECLLRAGAGSEQWRMLQLVWRQRGGGFGRFQRS